LLRFFPQKSGGIFQTDRFSVVIHESGLLIVIIPVKDIAGHMYREIPVSFIKFNEWHDLFLRFQNGIIEPVIDGIFQGHLSLGGEPVRISAGPVFIGKWRMEGMPLPEFPEKVKDMLSQRVFTGKIDHIVMWKRALPYKKIASVFHQSTLSCPDTIPGFQKCINAYRDFHLASREKDAGKTVELGLAMRRFMARDRKRPSYHLTAPMDVIFDPAATFYYNGRYHVFSYRNMVSLLAATPLVHYVSEDLVHWKDYPISVWADSEYDLYGIWLGNIIIDDQGVPNMLYTALGKNGKLGVLARSNDSLLSFTNKKAVIRDLVHHDGHTWKDENTWYSLTTKQYWGKRPGKKGDGILLLSSGDLVNWSVTGEIFCAEKYENPADERQEQGFTEFPYLLQFGDKHVLMMGTSPSKYWTGHFDKNIPAFVPDKKDGRLIDHLNTFHCFNPVTIDNKGPGGTPRRIIQAMYPYISGKVDLVPWSGVHTIPRVLTFNGDRLLQEPVPEMERLRTDHHLVENLNVTTQRSPVNSGLEGDAVELIAEFDPVGSGKFGLLIRTDKSGKNGIRIYYNSLTSRFGVDGNMKKPVNYPELGESPGYQLPGEKIRIRVFIDHALFEVFVNGETFTGGYDGDPDNTGIFVFSEQKDVILSKLDYWKMKSIWPFSD
jgi:sucrose-6-phosphate hydrolase SacC (GH32 family)